LLPFTLLMTAIMPDHNLVMTAAREAHIR
jgi:hypothetical protein